jgi:hypothetical protein
MTIERPMFPRHNATALKTFRSSYMDIESEILDLDRMGQIAFMLAQQHGVGDDIELLYFAVERFSRMAADLKKAYSAGFEQAVGE